MAYDEQLAERLRKVFKEVPNATESKMFGSVGFMVSNHMCCGIVKDSLMARVGPEQYADCLKLKHASEMDFTGRPMRGMVFVSKAGIEQDKDLKEWVDRCLVFVRSLPPKKKV